MIAEKDITGPIADQAWRLLDRIFYKSLTLSLNSRENRERCRRLDRLYKRALLRAERFTDCAYRYNPDTVT